MGVDSIPASPAFFQAISIFSLISSELTQSEKSSDSESTLDNLKVERAMDNNPIVSMDMKDDKGDEVTMKFLLVRDWNDHNKIKILAYITICGPKIPKKKKKIR